MPLGSGDLPEASYFDPLSIDRSSHILHLLTLFNNLQYLMHMYAQWLVLWRSSQYFVPPDEHQPTITNKDFFTSQPQLQKLDWPGPGTQ